MHEVWHVLEHALIDTLKIAPILLAVYFLIEFLEYKRLMQFQNSKMLKGKTSPIFGSLFGSLPQCGFSVISTDLFTKGFISIGALLAVYIATSDEALPIMLSHSDSWLSLIALLACKIVLGIMVGYLAMWLYPKVFKTKNIHFNLQNKSQTKSNVKHKANAEHAHLQEEVHNHENHHLGNEFVDENNKVNEHDLEEHNHEEHSHNAVEYIQSFNKEHTHDKGGGNGHEDVLEYNHLEDEYDQVNEHNHLEEEHSHEENSVHERIGCCNHDLESTKFDWKHPLLHCLKILLFILIINVVFGAIVEWIGEDKLTNFLSQSSALQPLLAVLIGLIPNCASSVVITELYLLGGLSFGAILAGLSVNAGLGLMVLFKQDKKPKEIIFILALLIIPSLLVGYGLHFLI